MLNPAWVEREAPLRACPLAACRRSGICRHQTDQDPCRRLHETRDAMYTALAIKLDRFKAQLIAERPPGPVLPDPQPGSALYESGIKYVYEALRAADQADSAREKAKDAAGEKQKPAMTPWG